MVDKFFKYGFTSLDNARGLEKETKSNKVIESNLQKTIASHSDKTMCIIHK